MYSSKRRDRNPNRQMYADSPTFQEALEQPPVIKTRYGHPPRPFPFLKLPGELRNKVYDMVIQDSRVIITGSHPNLELARLKHTVPNQKHNKPRYRLHGKFTRRCRTGKALSLVSRQVRAEVTQYTYARTTFCFDTLNVIHRFINRMPKAGITAIERLELSHKGYAEPKMMEDCKWKKRHDDKWERTLAAIRQEMISLKKFTLDLTFFDWPCEMEIDASWAQILVNFAGKGLENVKICVEHEMFHPWKLKDTATMLERRMTHPEVRRRRAREAKLKAELERQRKALMPKKAIKALTIRLPLADKPFMAQPQSRKVVRTKGLETFARAVPPPPGAFAGLTF